MLAGIPCEKELQATAEEVPCPTGEQTTLKVESRGTLKVYTPNSETRKSDRGETLSW
jgi:hypothetical protein